MLKLMSALGRIKSVLGGDWSFRALHEFLTHDLTDEERTSFFGTTLPHMCALALRLPSLFPRPLPLLLKGRAAAVELSHEQCACLMAHAFFCSMPFRADYSDTGRRGRHRASALDLPSFSLCRLHAAMTPPRAPGSCRFARRRGATASCAQQP